MDEIEFGISVLKYTRSSFERQILESCLIQENRHHHLLNSKAEYNRCAVPRLTTKIGEKDYEKYEKNIEEERKKEEILEGKIRQLRKERNRERKGNKWQEQPAEKRRKTDVSGEYQPQRNKWGRPKQKEDGEKRKGSHEGPPNSKKTRQGDIRAMFNLGSDHQKMRGNPECGSV